MALMGEREGILLVIARIMKARSKSESFNSNKLCSAHRYLKLVHLFIRDLSDIFIENPLRYYPLCLSSILAQNDLLLE